MSKTELVVVTDKIKSAGAIVWWRLAGSVDIDALSQAWANAGLPSSLLLAEPSPQAALRRACCEQKGARRLVRPLEGSKGFAVVDETADGDELDYDQRLTATVDIIGRIKLDGRATDGDAGIADAISAAYDKHLSEFSGQDISSWLVELMEQESDGVRLRDTGGIYFVPRTSIEAWRRMTSAIREASNHALFEVPAMTAGETVDAVLDAVAQEAAAEAADFEQVLTEGTVGHRALKNRASKCAAIEAKVSRYEELLGGSLDTLRERLEMLRANLVVASFKAEADEDYAGIGMAELAAL